MLQQNNNNHESVGELDIARANRGKLLQASALLESNIYPTWLLQNLGRGMLLVLVLHIQEFRLNKISHMIATKYYDLSNTARQNSAILVGVFITPSITQ